MNSNRDNPWGRRGIAGLVIGAALSWASTTSAEADSASMAKPLRGRDPIVEFASGVTALQAKRFEQAAALLQSAAEASPNNPDVWRFLGVAHAGLGAWESSRTALETAIQLDGFDVGAHAGLAVALAALGDPKAKTESNWVKERVEACDGKCADADYLKAMLDQVQSAASGRPSPVF